MFRRPSAASSGEDDVELDGIPLADFKSRDPVAKVSELVAAHPTPSAADSPAEGMGAAASASTSATGSASTAVAAAARHGDPDSKSRVPQPRSPPPSSSTPSSSSASPALTPFSRPNGHSSSISAALVATARGPLPSPHHDNGAPRAAAAHLEQPPSLLPGVAVDGPELPTQQQQQQEPTMLRHPTGLRGIRLGGAGAPAATAAAIKTGEYMRGIAAEARAWSAKVMAGATSGGGGSGGSGGGKRGGGWVRPDAIDVVTMLMPDSAMGDRIGGPSGRGPLLRRLQAPVQGMLNDFVVVTLTRPGPLSVRLKPDPRGLVILNNFDSLPDDPRTSCPRLGPLESVGNVMPGDALVSVNRQVLLGRPFSECVRCIKEACSSASVAFPCVLCFRRAGPECLGAITGAPPRNIEQEKLRILELLLEGGEGGLLDEARLRGITSTGVPDQGGLRPVLWRVLLRCLPANRLEWSEHLEAQRALYARFVDDLISKPAKIVTQGVAGARGEGASPTVGASTSSADPNDGRSPPAGASPQDPAGRKEALTIDPKESGAVANGADGPVHGSKCSLGRDVGRVEEDREGTTALAAGAQAADAPAAAAVSSTSRGATSPAEHQCQVGARRPADDDPLSNKETSEWAALWSDKELMQAIEQDVIRTMPDLAFYACRFREEDDDADSIHSGGGNAASGGNNGGARGGEQQRRRGRERREALARILFVHAKLNPAESYTQGMNEIVATLYFVLATEGDEEWQQHCEADTFCCFTNLMAEIRDVFIQSLDDSESGLSGKMEAFSRTLRQHDPELAEHMVHLALDPRYFALRWFTTLLSREFDLPDTIRLWDSLFAAQDRSTFLVFVFVTLLLAQRETLLAGDFASNLQLLQAYPPTEVPEVLAQSESLRLFSARGDAARRGGLAEQRAKEAADGAKQAAEQVNAAARRFWNAASDLATFHLNGERA